jgi:acetylglutamate kinase
VSRLVVKVGGAVADRSAAAVLELARENEVCVVHGAGPQISVEMERAGIPVEFVDGRRITSPEALAIVQASLVVVNAALVAAIGERAASLFGDDIGLELAPVPVPELGLVGEARPSALPAVRAALAAGKIAVVAPRGALNVNADDAAAAIAIGIEADELLFLTDVDGLILDGEVVGSIGVDAAAELLAGGSLRGGIIPKLGAAVTAARGGVRASIGQTAVAA